MLADAALLSALEDVVEHGPPVRRLETLRRITDLFVEGAAAFTEQHVRLFDDIFNRLIAEIEAKARAELSVRLAPIGNAPPRLVRLLAQDDNIRIAAPVLEHSARLQEPDLLHVAKSKSQDHLLAITNRNQIAEAVTDVIIRRGERNVVRNVAGNPGARLSQAGFSILIKRAEKDGFLAEKVCHRADIPPPLFRELLEQATQVVVGRLLATAKPETQAQIQRVLTQISRETGIDAVPRDYTAAWQMVWKIKCTGKLDEAALARLASEGRYEETVAGISLLCKVPIEIIHQLMADQRSDPILVVCKAVGFTWPTARAIVLLRTNGRGMSSHSLESSLRQYERLPASAAQNVLRYWYARHTRRAS